jgi:hypothetical protein
MFSQHFKDIGTDFSRRNECIALETGCDGGDDLDLFVRLQHGRRLCWLASGGHLEEELRQSTIDRNCGYSRISLGSHFLVWRARARVFPDYIFCGALIGKDEGEPGGVDRSGDLLREVPRTVKKKISQSVLSEVP